MNKVARIMEKFWLVLAIITTPFAVYYVIELGWQEGWIYLLFPLTAFMMFGYRKFMRQRFEN